MKRVMLIFVGTLLFMGFANVYGNEKFLTGALDEDKAMQELGSRIAEIKGKQEESNVFSKGEIKSSAETIERIEKVREDNIGGAIVNLKKTVEDSKENKGKYYDGARDEFEKAVKNMNVIYDKQVKGLMDKKDARELYEKQKQLLDALKDFQEELNKKNNKIEEGDLDKASEMSEKQEEIIEELDKSDIRKKMKDADEDIKNMKIPDAIKKQQEIVDQLKKDVDANNPESDSSQGKNTDEMEKKISEMEQKLQDGLNDPSKGMTDEQRQEMALQMSELAQDMKNQGGDQGEQQKPEGGDQGEQKKPEGGQGEQKPQPGGPGENMEQAMMDVLQKQDQQALAQLEAAKQAMQQMAQAGKPGKPMPGQPGQPMPGQPMPGQPPGMTSQGESKPKEQDSLYGQRNEIAATSDWKATLPAKERAALLAAQKAKYTSDMELSVRKYFKELAK